jgi:hypothetical protein
MPLSEIDISDEQRISGTENDADPASAIEGSKPVQAKRYDEPRITRWILSDWRKLADIV